MLCHVVLCGCAAGKHRRARQRCPKRLRPPFARGAFSAKGAAASPSFFTCGWPRARGGAGRLEEGLRRASSIGNLFGQLHRCGHHAAIPNT